MFTANGGEIPVYASIILTGSLRNCLWSFLIADVKVNTAIIGADFISNFGLVIDL